MAFHPLSASERRGILVVAALSLLITGGGLCVSYCDRPQQVIDPHEVEVLMERDSLSEAQADSVAKVRRKSLQKQRRDSIRRAKGKMKNKSGGSRKREEKVYRRRSPIDEPAK